MRMLVRSVSIIAVVCFYQTYSKTTARSQKKGLCIPPGERLYCGDFGKFHRASWWYNWRVEPNHNHEGWCHCPATNNSCGNPPNHPEFIPMITSYQEEDKPWLDDESDPVDDKYPIILGFNEPNREDHANLTPEKAAEGWMVIQEMYPDKILVSPAPAAGKTSWFDPFFEICESLGCRIDYLATHDYRGEVDKVMARLEDLYNRYGRKVWLTEFAKCCTRNVTEVEHFAREIIPRLEEADYVYKYSWFITRFSSDQQEHYGSFSSSTDDWYLDKVNTLLELDSWHLTNL